MRLIEKKELRDHKKKIQFFRKLKNKIFHILINTSLIEKCDSIRDHKKINFLRKFKNL